MAPRPAAIETVPAEVDTGKLVEDRSAKILAVALNEPADASVALPNAPATSITEPGARTTYPPVTLTEPPGRTSLKAVPLLSVEETEVPAALRIPNPEP